MLVGTLEVCHSRRFCITDSGHRGTVPHEAQVGNSIYFCVGATLLYVLRVTDVNTNEFRFVGEGKLHYWAAEMDEKVEELKCIDLI